jgi:hypothetical protein
MNTKEKEATQDMLIHAHHHTTMHLSPRQAAPEMSAKVSAKRLHTAQHRWTTLDNTGTPSRATGRNTPS